MALDPPPTHATTEPGSLPSAASSCARVSSPMTAWKSRTMRGEGIGPDDGTDDVVGVAHVGHPVADGLVGGVLERARTRVHGTHLGPQQLHAIDVQRLALDILRAHVDHALEIEERTHGRGGHPVLPGAGFGDDAALAHPARQQRLPEGVVDLVGAGVVEILALEVDGTRADGFLDAGAR